MPEFAEIARTLTDTAVVHLAAIAPLFAGGAVALIGAVVSCVAWLCYAELRRGRSHWLAQMAPAERNASPRHAALRPCSGHPEPVEG